VAQIQMIWNKLNPRERLTAWGALAIGIGWLIGLTASYGIGGGGLSLIGAIVVLIILYLKYAPNQRVTWPAPIPTIILVITAIVALGALLTLLNMLQLLGLVGYGFVAGAILAGLVTAAGAVLMVWGAWQEYQLTVATPNTPGPSTPVAPPPPPSPPSDTDHLPPA